MVDIHWHSDEFQLQKLRQGLSINELTFVLFVAFPLFETFFVIPSSSFSFTSIRTYLVVEALKNVAA